MVPKLAIRKHSSNHFSASKELSVKSCSLSNIITTEKISNDCKISVEIIHFNGIEMNDYEIEISSQRKLNKGVDEALLTHL